MSNKLSTCIVESYVESVIKYASCLHVRMVYMFERGKAAKCRLGTQIIYTRND